MRDRKDHSSFRTAVGKLLSISQLRDDIKYPVKELSRSLSNPQESDLDNLKHLLKYVNQTRQHNVGRQFLLYFGCSGYRLSRDRRQPRFRFSLVRSNQRNSFRKAFQPEFGAYGGLAGVLKSPSNPQNCRNTQKNLENCVVIFCAKPCYAPNPGSKEI